MGKIPTGLDHRKQKAQRCPLNHILAQLMGVKPCGVLLIIFLRTFLLARTPTCMPEACSNSKCCYNKVGTHSYASNYPHTIASLHMHNTIVEEFKVTFRTLKCTRACYCSYVYVNRDSEPSAFRR